MKSWAQAAALLVLSGFGLSLLLALGERDWFHCFAHADGIRPAMPSLFAPGELMPVLLETLTPPFGHPLLFLLHFAPGLGFGFFWLRSQSKAQRNALLIAFSLFILLAGLLLLPPGSQHDCDRKGTDGLFALFLLSPFGYLLAVTAALLPRIKRTPQ